MCFCLSGCMVNWWTNRSPLAFSFIALYPVFLRQGSDCLVDFLYVIFFFWLSDRVEYSLNLFAFSLKDLLVLLLGFVFFFCNHAAWFLALQCAHQSFLFLVVLYLTYSTVPISLCVAFGLCSPHPLWFFSLMDSLSTHRRPHATPASSR